MERIIAEDISKKFKIGYKKNQSALARAISYLSGKEPKRTIDALKDISFKVNTGEIVGIIGENGSGKTTLLRVIAGIYSPTKGKIIINGKIISLINLNAGMILRLTMKDNIFLVGSFFGLSHKDIQQRFNSIVKFSELDDFIETKIYQFSEGMKQRLIFSVAIHCKPEIILLDEVFEIGDEKFRKKGVEKINQLVKNGAAVLLASNELWMIEKYCDRTIWLHKGRIAREGKTEKVVKAYLNEKSDI